jgi:hypothetical protein
MTAFTTSRSRPLAAIGENETGPDAGASLPGILSVAALAAPEHATAVTTASDRRTERLKPITTPLTAT